MMDFLNNYISVSWFTGLGPIVTKLGVTGLLIAGLLAFEVLAPSWLLPRLRKFTLLVAVVLGYGFIAYTVGVHDEYQRWDKWYKAALKAEAANGEKVRKNAERVVRAQPPASVRLDPRNRDNRK